MATVAQVNAVVHFIQSYINDSKKPTKSSFYCPRESFNLLKEVKNKIGADKADKNAISFEHLTIFIFHKEDRWYIHIRNNDLVEPKGPM